VGLVWSGLVWSGRRQSPWVRVVEFGTNSTGRRARNERRLDFEPVCRASVENVKAALLSYTNSAAHLTFICLELTDG